ncbi:MAG: cysteine--tRNA ligase [Acidiferrobacterales bacterium]
MVQIYNSLTKRKEPFTPIEPGHVRIYVCGMTVYDYCHVGHARVMVFFDAVVRYLRARGYRVTYVRNITDIDDKIIKRAAERGEDVETLTARFIKAMHDDTAPLGVLPPDAEPRATRHVEQIKAMITMLLDNGYAYRGDNGDVYYDVSRFADYGALSGQQLGELRAGARVEIDEAKDDPVDFVLWKAAKTGEPCWESLWGPGRPGWHIECSAMSTQSLGEHFDIHGGGMDLKFPHHDSEIAQSEAATGKKFVNVWMHVGFVQIDQQKMSKSLGNFFTIREVLKKYDPEVVRYFLLASHYRSPLNFSNEALDNARAGLVRLYTALKDLPVFIVEEKAPEYTRAWKAFTAAVDDDFNTPGALAVLFDLARDVNRYRGHDTERAARSGATLRSLGNTLGLLHQDPVAFLQAGTQAAAQSAIEAKVSPELSGEQIQLLIDKRAEARRSGDYAEADRIRDELSARGVVLEDGPERTTWRRE